MAKTLPTEVTIRNAPEFRTVAAQFGVQCGIKGRPPMAELASVLREQNVTVNPTSYFNGTERRAVADNSGLAQGPNYREAFALNSKGEVKRVVLDFRQVREAAGQSGKGRTNQDAILAAMATKLRTKLENLPIYIGDVPVDESGQSQPRKASGNSNGTGSKLDDAPAESSEPVVEPSTATV